jgi:hypothetical protein
MSYGTLQPNFRKIFGHKGMKQALSLSYSAMKCYCVSCSYRLPGVVWVIKCWKLRWDGRLASILRKKEHFLYKLRGVVRIVTCTKLRWAGYVARVGRHGMYKSYRTGCRLKSEWARWQNVIPIGCVGLWCLELSKDRSRVGLLCYWCCVFL